MEVEKVETATPEQEADLRKYLQELVDQGRILTFGMRRDEHQVLHVRIQCKPGTLNKIPLTYNVEPKDG